MGEQCPDVHLASARRKPFLSVDPMTVFAGEEWMSRIFEELKSCTVLISMLSQRSIERPWINFEAGAVWMSDGKFVIPVCYDGLKVDQLSKPYSALQAVDLETFEGSYYLVDSIAKHVGLPIPKKPIFAPWSGAAAALSGRDPKENEELLTPYKFIQASIALIKTLRE